VPPEGRVHEKQKPAFHKTNNTGFLRTRHMPRQHGNATSNDESMAQGVPVFSQLRLHLKGQKKSGAEAPDRAGK
jgi:hypothetical protein